MTTNEDKAIYKQFQESPIYFIEKVWKLRPQPIRDEYFTLVYELIDEGRLDEVKAEHFSTFIKGKHITWQQWLVLLSIERALQKKGSKKISVVSGHGIGKDAVLSMIIIWYLFCFLNAQVAATAPTSELMHDVLWKELKVWLDKMPKELSSLYEWSNGYLRIKEAPETWFARARTARKEAPEAIAGVHGDYVLIPVDEASGVPEEIFRTAEGSLTGENTLVILISNGTRNEGYFYDSHHQFKHLWQTLSFSSEESPIVEKEYVEGIVAKYGLESDEYKIRVKGKFPGSEQMDQGGWINLIEETKITQVSPNVPFLGRVKLGVDPAGEGSDESVWKLRDEFIEKTVAKESISTSKTISLKTAQFIEDYKLKDADIIIDNFGVGANVSRELALLPKHYGCWAVNWAEPADDPDTYLNKRAECYFRLRNWLLNGGAVTSDSTKRQISQIKFKRNLKGKIQIMEKKDLIKHVGKSPDEADALALSFYNTRQEYKENNNTNTTNVSQYADGLHSVI